MDETWRHWCGGWVWVCARVRARVGGGCPGRKKIGFGFHNASAMKRVPTSKSLEECLVVAADKSLGLFWTPSTAPNIIWHAYL